MAIEKMQVKKHPTYHNKDGIRVPSVTTIISTNLGWDKNALIQWSRKMALQGIDPEPIRDEAANTGTLAHFFIECYIKHDLPDTEGYEESQIKQAEQSLMAFIDWEAENGVTIKESEIQLVSNKYNFGGTIDLVGSLGGDFAIIDLKTSKAIYASHVIQVAAYKAMYEENVQAVKDCFILRLDKDSGEFHYRKLEEEDLSAGWTVFQKCLELNKYKEQLERIK